jgi:hypothetical protein
MGIKLAFSSSGPWLQSRTAEGARAQIVGPGDERLHNLYAGGYGSGTEKPLPVVVDQL